MKAKINQNGREVEIDLTPEQIEIVNSAKFGDYRDITTFEEACEAIGWKWKEPIGLPVDIIAYMKLRIIAKALNGGSWMTYQDTDEGKYYPWFTASGSASGFSADGYDCGDSNSGVGSRLTFKTSEIAKYAGTQFLEIYNLYIN